MHIILAQQAPFQIGTLHLVPATREIVAGDASRMIVEPRVMQVLIALARAGGAIVTRDELTASCWEGRIVGEDAINRVISRLRRAAGDSGDVFRIETVTRVGYRLLLCDTGEQGEQALAAPVAEPEGDDAALRPADMVAPHSARQRWAIGGAALAVVALLVLIAIWPPAANVTAGNPVPQLVVEPFVALSADVPDSIAAMAQEEVIATLGQTSLTEVSTKMPARLFKKPDNLVWRLNGSIARRGADLHFVVHLTHVSTNVIVWTGAIDRPAAPINTALKGMAAVVSEVVIPSIDAAASYRNGALPDATMALMAQFNQDTTQPAGPYIHANDVVRRAVALTPDFGAGWSTLALALGYTATASNDPAAMAAARAEAPAVIARALELSPDDPLALLARAKIVPLNDFIARDSAYSAAARAFPSASGAEHSGYSVFLVNVGRAAEAVHEAKIACDLTPSAGLYRVRYATALSSAGQTEIAVRQLDMAETQWPGDGPMLSLRARIGLWAGDQSASIAAIDGNYTISAPVRAAMRAAVVAVHDESASQKAAAADRLVELSKNTATNSEFIVSALAALGRNTDAVAAADRLISSTNASAAAVLFDPSFASARYSAEFLQLVTKIGLLDYWHKTGHAPDFCGASEPPLLCVGLLRNDLPKLQRKAASL